MDLKQCDKKQLKEEFNKLTALTNYKATIGVFDIFSKLPEILNEGENVLCVNSGVVKSSIWLIVPTDKRVIFLHKKNGLFHKKIDYSSINYDSITSVDSSTGLTAGKIRINTPGTIYEVGTLQKNSVQPLAEFILSQKNGSSSQPANNSSDDLLSKLEKLGKLKESGVLTEEEFQEQKSKLLNL